MSNQPREWEGKRGLYVSVRDNNVDQAIRVLKKKANDEGIPQELKKREFYTRKGERLRLQRMEYKRRAKRANDKQNAEWKL